MLGKRRTEFTDIKATLDQRLRLNLYLLHPLDLRACVINYNI